MGPKDIIEMLGLRLGSCGYTGLTYECPLQVAGGDSNRLRSLGASLLFLITPDAGVTPHRIPSDQIYHYYAGQALEVLLLRPDGDPGRGDYRPKSGPRYAPAACHPCEHVPHGQARNWPGLGPDGYDFLAADSGWCARTGGHREPVRTVP